MKNELDQIKIEIKISKKPKLLATAVIDFVDITVKGFRLSESEYPNENLDNEHAYLQPPSYRAGPTFQRTIFFKDKDVWKHLERKVFVEYTKIKDDNLWVE